MKGGNLVKKTLIDFTVHDVCVCICVCVSHDMIPCFHTHKVW